MQTETNKTLEVLAKEFNLSKDTILKESLKIFLEKKLREIKTEIFKITGKEVKRYERKYTNHKIF